VIIESLVIAIKSLLRLKRLRAPRPYLCELFKKAFNKIHPKFTKSFVVMTVQTIPKRFKFAKGVIWLFLVLSVLLLSYTYYRAEIIYQGNVSEKYFKYYVISLTGILFSGLVARLKDELKLNIVMAITILVVGVYLIEIALQSQFDTRSRYQVYQDLKTAGVDAVPRVLPAFFRESNGIAGSEPLFPLAGISKKNTVFCNESGEYSIYLSDRYGFNNPDSEWDTPQTEWLLTGDSFTHGACVEPGEDIAGQIRLITNESALTLGMGGNGPLQELATLKEYAEFRKPKKVLWLYYEENDLSDLKKESSVPLLMSYLKPKFSQNLIQRQKEIDNRLKIFIEKSEENMGDEGLVGKARGLGEKNQTVVNNWFLSKTKALRLYHIRGRMGFDDNINTHLHAHNNVRRQMDTSVDPLFTQILKQTRDQTAAWGGKLYFIYLPAKTRYETGSKGRVLFKHSNAVLEVAKNLGLSIINIHREVFSSHPDPMSLFPNRMYNHYSPTGYNAVAKAIILSVESS